MPRLSDSMTEGTILMWLVSEGQEVQAGQPLVEIETDKATVTHEADEAGTVLELLVAAGATVSVGAPIAVMAPPGGVAGAASSSPRQSPATAPRPSVPPASRPPGPPASRTSGPPTSRPSDPRAQRTTATRPRPIASPLARRIAADAGLDLIGLPGSGPQGRVIRADVERALADRDGASAGGAVEPVVVQELSRLQRTVARRMSESRATVPDIELRRQVDIAACIKLRSRLRELEDPVPTYNDFVVKAAALALRAFPRVNSSYREGRFERPEHVNIGIAVAAEDALIVPTILDADRKSLGQIAAEARALAERVRAGTITPAELDGATFTVSNLGMYGVDSFSAIINPPQAAILTVGSVRQRPVVDSDGAVVARPTLVLSLACDHRILYGADAARFLGAVAEYLEQPLSLLMG
jgi:pyruvate dehydrogenase E2 component (dihydrolipoamide acetyltransferase)